VDSVFGGSTEGLVMTLLDGKTLTKDEADRIRAAIVRVEKAEEEQP
jgi:hypothetical protein